MPTPKDIIVFTLRDAHGMACDRSHEDIPMITASFALNREKFSSFLCDIGSFSAFSGEGKDRNNPDSVSKKDKGPIPLGDYYIVNRKSGGRLGWLIDRIKDKDEWFALYRDDGSIDDETFVDGVRRGQFRLHPGRLSVGCITFEFKKEYAAVRKHLLSQPVAYIPHTKTRTYGTVMVTKAELVPMLDQRYRQPSGEQAAMA